MISNTRSFRAAALALIALGIVSRLPQLLSPNLLLDGDEAMLGLMASHLAQARELPLFFWGQHYGWSTVEAAFGAAAFLIAGTGAVQLKVAMLLLWLLGIVFLFAAQTAVVGVRRSFWTTALLILCPGWAVWSMKARGGYLTAFAATAVLLWLLAAGRERLSTSRWVAAGVLTAIVYLAQPLFLPSVLPILLAAWWPRRVWRWIALSAAAGVGTVLLVEVATVAMPARGDWNGTPIFGNEFPLQSIPRIAHQIVVMMTGAYYLWFPRTPPGSATFVLGRIWSAALLPAMAVQAFRLVTRRFAWWSHMLFASIALTIVAEFITLGARDPRYMLPLVAPTVLLAGFEWTDLAPSRRVLSGATGALTAALLLIGAASLVEFQAFNFLWTNGPRSMSEAARLRRVMTYLRFKNVSHVYAMNGLLEWQLTFYAGEQVVARWVDPEDRRPAYPRLVDTALLRGEPVAIVGYTADSGAPGCSDGDSCTGGIQTLVSDPDQIFVVDGKYFVYAGADRALLEKMHFRVWD